MEGAYGIPLLVAYNVRAPRARHASALFRKLYVQHILLLKQKAANFLCPPFGGHFGVVRELFWVQ
jgi:hypothetical protein